MNFTANKQVSLFDQKVTNNVSPKTDADPFEDVLTDNLYVTIAVTGYFEEEKYAEHSMLLLGTAPLNLYLSEFEVLDTDSYEIELGQLPTGTVYFELLVHEGPTFVNESLLDFIWFDGETETPFVE